MPKHNSQQPKTGTSGSTRHQGPKTDRRERGKGEGRDSKLNRDVLVSKKVSYVLRHGAEKEGLKVDEKGFVNCADLVCFHLSPSYNSYKQNLTNIMKLVEMASPPKSTRLIHRTPTHRIHKLQTEIRINADTNTNRTLPSLNIHPLPHFSRAANPTPLSLLPTPTRCRNRSLFLSNSRSLNISR